MLSEESAGDTPLGCMGKHLQARDQATLAESYLGMLGGHIRLNLLRALAEQAGSVTDLSIRLGASVPLVSHNLRRMQDAGLVQGQSLGRRRTYSLDNRVAIGRDGRLHVSVTLEGGWQIRIEAPMLPPERTFPPQTHTTPLVILAEPARKLAERAGPPSQSRQSQSSTTESALQRPFNPQTPEEAQPGIQT